MVALGPAESAGAVPVGTRVPTLSDILRMENDSSLQLIGISVEDGVVRVKFRRGNATDVKHYTSEEARRVVSDLMAWADDSNRSRA